MRCLCLFIGLLTLIAGSSALRAQQATAVGTDAAEIIELLNKYRPDPEKLRNFIGKSRRSRRPI
jgi:hypothetical protein